MWGQQFNHTITATKTNNQVGIQCYPRNPLKDFATITIVFPSSLQTSFWVQCYFCTVFENHQKCCIFHQFFVKLKLTYLVTMFGRKLHVFKKSPKWAIFGIFN